MVVRANAGTRQEQDNSFARACRPAASNTSADDQNQEFQFQLRLRYRLHPHPEFPPQHPHEHPALCARRCSPSLCP